MTLWLNRAGAHGEFEQRFLDDGRIYCTWFGLRCDLNELASQDAVRDLLARLYPTNGPQKNVNHASQIWAFSHRMGLGDWVVLPSKLKPAIHIGEIAGPYVYDPQAEDPFQHHRAVKWIARDVPRSNFDQDLLYSFGAFMTTCQIRRNDAEVRVRKMAEGGWRASSGMASIALSTVEQEAEEGEVPPDLEEVGRDQIARTIQAKFKGHGLAVLVEAILKAQGYTTFRSPEGPDKGIDLLAAPGAMGFGQPRLCVQVKSGDSPVDRPTLDQLLGTMQNVHAEHGLLVAWGGFRSSVDRDTALQFFRIRLWDRDDLLDQLFDHYERLDDDLRAELPLKRIWTLATTLNDED